MIIIGILSLAIFFAFLWWILFYLPSEYKKWEESLFSFIPKPISTFEVVTTGKPGCKHRWKSLPWDEKLGPEISDFDDIKANTFACCTSHSLWECEKCGERHHQKERSLI